MEDILERTAVVAFLDESGEPKRGKQFSYRELDTIHYILYCYNRGEEPLDGLVWKDANPVGIEAKLDNILDTEQQNSHREEQ